MILRFLAFKMMVYGSFLSEKFADFYGKYGLESPISQNFELKLRMIVKCDMIWGGGEFYKFRPFPPDLRHGN